LPCTGFEVDGTDGTLRKLDSNVTRVAIGSGEPALLSAAGLSRVWFADVILPELGVFECKFTVSGTVRFSERFIRLTLRRGLVQMGDGIAFGFVPAHVTA
jgi:hypothetical protein